MNLLERIIPRHIREEQEEREKTTDDIVSSSRKARRQADSDVIKAYRSVGKVVRRHGWSE